MRQEKTGRSPLWLAMLLLLIPVVATCRGDRRQVARRRPETPAAGERPYLLETVGEFAVSRLYADGFEALSPSERVLAFYLYRAALAGRDIYYDQAGRQNLEIRDLLEEILTHPRQVAPATLSALHAYLKLFWINNGNHHARTGVKFVPAFGFHDLEEAAVAARRDGAEIRLALGETLEEKLLRLRPALFDKKFEPLLTCKTPPSGRDILTCSSVNFYEGVRLGDLRGFVERFPRNSRLVRGVDGRLVEEVYRAGRGAVPPGRYARELLAMEGFLAKAAARAEPGQAATLGRLAEFLGSGDPETLRGYEVAWLKLRPTIDAVVGFIEPDKDPRARKGAYEGLVYFLSSPPGAAILLAAVGEGGPMPPAGIDLPHDAAMRQRTGGKSLSFVNVHEAVARAGAAASASSVAFVMPDLIPIRDVTGEVVDARVDYASDLTSQMLKYSGKFPLEATPPTPPSGGLP